LKRFVADSGGKADFIVRVGWTGVCGHRAHVDGSSARKAADVLAFCCGRR
jgi:hypothetical protein